MWNLMYSLSHEEWDDRGFAYEFLDKLQILVTLLKPEESDVIKNDLTDLTSRISGDASWVVDYN